MYLGKSLTIKPKAVICDIVVMPRTESGTIIKSFYWVKSRMWFIRSVALNVSTSPYAWGSANSIPGRNLVTVFWWNTAALHPADNDRPTRQVPIIVFVQSWLNNMENNYLNGTSAYCGKNRFRAHNHHSRL